MSEHATSTDGGRARSTSGLLYAVLGAVVMTVFSWIPFAPVVGGAAGGYLEATQPDDGRAASSRGLRVGGLAGLVATVPAVLVMALVASAFTAGFLGLGATGGMSPEASVGFGLFGLVLGVLALVALLAYHAGLGAIGGWLGAKLAEDSQAGAGQRGAGRRSGVDHDTDGQRDAGTGRDDDRR